MGNAGQRFLAAADEEHGAGVGGQHLGADGADGAVGADDGDGGLFEGDVHAAGGLAGGFDGDGDGVAVAGGDGDVEAAGHREAAVADDGGEGAEADDARAQALGVAAGLRDFVVDDGRRQAEHEARGEGAGDEPAVEGAAVADGAGALDLGDVDGRVENGEQFDEPDGQPAEGRVFAGHVAPGVDGVDDEGEGAGLVGAAVVSLSASGLGAAVSDHAVCASLSSSWRGYRRG